MTTTPTIITIKNARRESVAAFDARTFDNAEQHRKMGAYYGSEVQHYTTITANTLTITVDHPLDEVVTMVKQARQGRTVIMNHYDVKQNRY